jgi:hypothetical protein
VVVLAAAALMLTAGVSGYYAFVTRTDGGVSYSGFNLTLTTNGPSVSVPKGDVLIVIPKGILTNPALSFEPLNLRVEIGVNNTLLFYNEDTYVYMVESLQWPAGSPGFGLSIGPDKTGTVELNATGTYVYNFEQNPTGYNGTVTVFAA